MNRFFFLLSLLFFLLLLVPLNPISAQEEEEEPVLTPNATENTRLEKRYERYLKQMNKKSLEKIWDIAAKIEELGEEVLPFIKSSLDNEEEGVQLGLSKALITLGDPEFAMSVLLDLVEQSGNLEIKIQACKLIGSDGFASLKESLLPLLEEAEDPYFRIALASALWEISQDESALKQLTEYLSHSDREIVHTTALALGELGLYSLAEKVLLQLKSEPTLRGRLAQVFLQQKTILENIKKFQEEEKKNPTAAGERVPTDPVEETKKMVSDFLATSQKIDGETLSAVAGKGMTHALGFDTHSELWTPEEYQKFAESIDQNYAGIGAYVGVRDGELTVINPIYSGPAYKAGLRSGDRILAVEGEPTDDVTVDTVIKKLKGALNQPIVIRIQREGWTEPRDITIIRQMIQISSCKWTLLPENIAYCWLTQFGDKTAEELEAALKTMEGQGMKACILDLRQNGGGYLQTAIDVVGLFVKNNTLVVWSEGRNTEIAPRNNLYSRCKSPKESLPLVCLINGNSASSSEITAGALKVHQRATLIGERSYGKGTVQQPLPLEQWLGAYLKLTIARYYLPNGRSIHKEKDREGNIIQGKEGGIKPDIEVPMRKGEPWLNEAYQLVKRSKKLENFVSTHYEKERPLFQKLAENDFRDPALYPEFEALYLSLETKASRDDVRRWLRELVKVRAADDRGSEFVGDFNEDPQLQRAILEILFQLKKDPRTLPAYRAFISEYQALIQSQKFD